MAKYRRKYLRPPAATSTPLTSSAGQDGDGETERELDVRKLSLMLIVLSIVFVPFGHMMMSSLESYLPTAPDPPKRVVAEDAKPIPIIQDRPEENEECARIPESQQPQGQQQISFSIVNPGIFKSSWDMIMHFTKDHNVTGLHNQLYNLFTNGERNPNPERRKFNTWQQVKDRGGGYDRTTRHKLMHDLEQWDYILRNKNARLAPSGVELFGSTLPRLYRKVLHHLDDTVRSSNFDEENEFYMFAPEDREIVEYYNRAHWMPDLPPPDGPRLAPRDWSGVERRWFGEDAGHPHPGIVVVDDILSPQTLQRVREYLLLSTFWYDSKLPKFGKYVGAYLTDGMYDTMMTEIAFELQKAMPRVMTGHHLKEIWSYKYESSTHEDEERTGIHVHADDAIVNVNLWITPDEANLDPSSGGLVVFTVKPPREWSFDEFNANWEYIDEHLLRPSGYANVTVPYRQNRAVIFDSFLFHKTDKHRFRSGYENRRINLTFLYGGRQSVEYSAGGRRDVSPEGDEL